jgi:hypothetical protein
MTSVVCRMTGPSARTGARGQGKLVYHTADGDIEIADGEAFCVAPGHTPEIFPDIEIVELSPTAEANEMLEIVMKNMRE